MNIATAVRTSIAIPVIATLALSACGGGGNNLVELGGQTPDVGAPSVQEPPQNGQPPQTGGEDRTGSVPAWGPRLPSSNLSPVEGAADDFASVTAAALTLAARAAPLGASQSSRTEEGRTADEFSVSVVRDDDGNLVHEVTDNSQMMLRVPGMRQDTDIALFTDLPVGIEPDLSSYPHDVWGLWAWDGGVGAFYDRSPSVPPVTFDARTPVGRAVYEGDAVGLGSVSGTTAKFLADVEMVADFDARTVSGAIDGFRSLDGTATPFSGSLEVRLLGTAFSATGTAFSATGAAFSGDTAARDGTADIAGDGKWGARWTDGSGEIMGGTFGFAAEDGNVALLGAFGACHCARAAGGSNDEPVAGETR